MPDFSSNQELLPEILDNLPPSPGQYAHIRMIVKIVLLKNIIIITNSAHYDVVFS